MSLNHDILSTIKFKNAAKEDANKKMRDIDHAVVARDQQDFENYQKMLEERKKKQKIMMAGHWEEAAKISKARHAREATMRTMVDSYEHLNRIGLGHDI